MVVQCWDNVWDLRPALIIVSTHINSTGQARLQAFGLYSIVLRRHEHGRGVGLGGGWGGGGGGSRGDVPANTGHSPNVVSMLGQRRRRWANIETALVGHFTVRIGIAIIWIPPRRD